MSSLIVDAQLAAQFAAQQEDVPLCGPDGRLLGIFVPLLEGTAEEYEQAIAAVDEAEIERSRQSGYGRTYAEIMTTLRERHGS